MGRRDSFIHYGDLYSAHSRLLLRSAPDPCTAKEKSFEARVKCVRKNPGEQSLRQRKPITHRGPTTENARACVRARGTKSNPCSDERSELRPLVPGVGQQRSRMTAKISDGYGKVTVFGREMGLSPCACAET